jgi:hypothetical protein
MKIPACQVIGNRGAPRDALRAPDLTYRGGQGHKCAGRVPIVTETGEPVTARTTRMLADLIIYRHHFPSDLPCLPTRSYVGFVIGRGGSVWRDTPGAASPDLPCQ